MSTNQRLWISAGHSGNEVGTVSRKDGTTEESIARRVTTACKELGMNTVPFGMKLVDRIGWINDHIPATDLLIELHQDTTDSNPRTDCGIFYFAGNAFSRRSASTIIEQWQDFLKIDDVWIKADNQSNFGRLGIIRDTKPIAWLIEMNDIDDIEIRNLAINKGASALLQIEKILIPGVENVVPEPVDENPSAWAVEAWNDFVKKGIIRSGDPRGELTNEAMQLIFQRLGAVSVIEPTMSRERFVLALFRLLNHK